MARPAMAPTQAPTRVGLPLCAHSIMSHTKRAQDAEISVLMRA